MSNFNKQSARRDLEALPDGHCQVWQNVEVQRLGTAYLVDVSLDECQYQQQFEDLEEAWGAIRMALEI